MKNGTPFDRNQFMLEYVKGTGTSPFVPCADPLADAKAWLRQAMTEKLPVAVNPLTSGNSELIGQWAPGDTPADWKIIEWTLPAERLPKLKGILFAYASGNHRLEIQSVALVADGKVVAEDKHFGYAGKPDSRNFYKLAAPAGTTANNGCLIRAVVKGGGGTNSKGAVNLILAKP